MTGSQSNQQASNWYHFVQKHCISESRINQALCGTQTSIKNSGITNKWFRSFSFPFHFSHILSLKYMIFLPHLVSAEHKNVRSRSEPSCIWIQTRPKGRLQDCWTAEACFFLTCLWPCLGFSSSFSNRKEQKLGVSHHLSYVLEKTELKHHSL